MIRSFQNRSVLYPFGVLVSLAVNAYSIYVSCFAGISVPDRSESGRPSAYEGAGLLHIGATFAFAMLVSLWALRWKGIQTIHGGVLVGVSLLLLAGGLIMVSGVDQRALIMALTPFVFAGVLVAAAAHNASLSRGNT